MAIFGLLVDRVVEAITIIQSMYAQKVNMGKIVHYNKQCVQEVEINVFEEEEKFMNHFLVFALLV